VLAHIAPFDKRIYEEAKDRLMELIPTDLRELHFETIVKGGDVRDEILGIVKDKEIDLVIMGSHGRGAVERLILGSVTERMLRKLPVPVLTVSQRASAHSPSKAGTVPLRRILYASDLSDDSDIGLQFSMRLARGLDARLIVAHVIDPLGNGFLNEQAVSYGPNYADGVRTQGEEYLNRLVTRQSDGSIPITTVLGEGKPWVVINGIAAGCKADLIVINLHDKGPIERMLLGSTAEQVVRTASVPVLSLPMPATYTPRWVAA
jgi:nucleotide-binding universal stress UspA family protein